MTETMTGSPVRTVTVTVNGTPMSALAEDRTLLSDHLRRALALTGTNVGCEQGVCGSCTVLLDGVPVRSCLTLAVQADGCAVRTVEGLADGEKLSPVQQAVLDCHGLQCGFCTPGLLMSLTHAREQGLCAAEVTEDVLRGHLCRCTGYGGIRRAVARIWGDEASDCPDSQCATPEEAR